MAIRSYPIGIDCIWIVADQHENVGAFATGGEGPIPLLALEVITPPIEELEELLNQLPRISDFQLKVTMPRPDDFVALAQRGLFAYDWADVHRTARESSGAYELIATPHDPIKLDSLPNSLREIAKRIRLKTGAFSNGQSIAIREEFECSPSM